MGKTIITHLIEGSPQGIQSVTIGNRTCKMYMVPRTSLPAIKDRDDLRQPALYILLGEDESLMLRAYIGESENFYERIKNHDNNKNFWQRALVFIADNNALNKADVQYLEHLSIRIAHKAKRYSLTDNKQIPKAPNLPEHQKDTIDEFFDDVKMLASFINCSVFEIAEQKDKPLFFVRNRGCDAKGFYDENGFTVLKGSIIAKTTVPSFGWKDNRDDFIKEYTYIEKGNFVLNADYTFPSPSAAANYCIGSSNNGWITWKNIKGQTLDEVYRGQLE